MHVLTSTMSDALGAVYDEFSEKFGFGPCGAYAALKREEGWGKVAIVIAETADGKTEFPHYVITNGKGERIIDLANPFDDELTYRDMEILDDDEMPELNDDREAIEWLKTRNV